MIIAFMFRFLVPYTQLGRNLVPEQATFSDRIALTSSLLTDIETVRQDYTEQSAETYADNATGYYDSPQGFFDRLHMIAPDDGLIYSSN